MHYVKQSLDPPSPTGFCMTQSHSGAGNQVWFQSGFSLLNIQTWVRFSSNSVPLRSSQDFSPRWDCSMGPSSSERPVSMVMTKDATEALLAIGCSSPWRGRETRHQLLLVSLEKKKQSCSTNDTWTCAAVKAVNWTLVRKFRGVWFNCYKKYQPTHRVKMQSYFIIHQKICTLVSNYS